jgi:hypothetical protein
MIEEKYLKYGMAIALALHVVAILFGVYEGGTLLAGFVAAALGFAVAERFGLAKAKVELCEAHIYKHLELGTLLYCDSEQATHTDYQYLGTAKVPCDKVGRCSLA